MKKVYLLIALLATPILGQEFKYSPVEGIGYDPDVTRRDNSDIIRVGDRYYIWYSRTTTGKGGGDATVWYATSPDGKKWTEHGEAVGKGAHGAWDGGGAFTPNILVARDKYFLFYSGRGSGGTTRFHSHTRIGLAWSDSPDGPWQKSPDNPIIKQGNPGEYDINKYEKPDKPYGEWDSHLVDDSCLLVRDGKYWLYYKGRQIGRGATETKMGVAIADKPEGPYVKSPSNPLTNSGHEVLAWPHKEGVAALITYAGPEKNTIQYAPDGLHFSVMAKVANAPLASGAYRPDAFTGTTNGQGIAWGICLESKPRPHLQRFECDLTGEPNQQK
jgi:beta-xylosidase